MGFAKALQILVLFLSAVIKCSVSVEGVESSENYREGEPEIKIKQSSLPYLDMSVSLMSILTSNDLRPLLVAAGTALVGVTSYILMKIIGNSLQKRQYIKAAAKRRSEVQQRINDMVLNLEVNNELVTDDRKKILALPIEELLLELKEKRLTAVQVLQAYQAKAIEITRKCNSITEFVWEAEEYAVALDEAGPQEGQILFGLPVSIKDNFHIKGYDSTIGIAKFLGQPATEDCAILASWRRLGAIPFCHTNVPQTMYSYHSSNPVWGVTTNPYDSKRSAGGSSCGEASLIALGGSPLGLGSDIGGSVRIPAHFCGNVSIKPTANRISYKGTRAHTKGIAGLEVSAGIMGPTVNAVALGFKSLTLDDFMYRKDSTTVPMLWNENVYKSNRPLRIGYYESLDVFPALPGCRRAVQVAKEALERKGHVVVPIRVTDGYLECKEFLQYMAADGGQHIGEAMKNEVWDKCVISYRLLLMVPRCLIEFGYLLLSVLTKRASIITSGAIPTAYEFLKRLGVKKDLVDSHLQKWDEAEIDALICPTFPFPALPLSTVHLPMPAVYTGIYNLLNFPAGCVPVTRESKDDQEDLKKFLAEDLFISMMKKATFKAEGLPLTAMVVARPWQEELVLRVMKDIQDNLKEKYV